MVKGAPPRAVRPWWLPVSGQPPGHPGFEPFLLGLSSRALDLLLTAGLLGLLVASRVIAFPASIWEQDEAYFSAGVVQFEPTVNHPHPPWFPLWIATGKLMHLTGVEPATGLQLAAAVASVWMLFPLASLFSRLLRRELAATAAAMALLLPGPWILAGRAFSEIPATALLALAAALWASQEARESTLVAGSAAAGACLLVRPQLVLAVLAMAAVVGLRLGRGRVWLALLAPAAAELAVAYAVVVVAAGGVAPLAAALATHAAYHFGSMDASSYAFAGSGLARCLVNPFIAAAWLTAAVAGLFAMLRRRATLAPAAALLGAALVGLALTIWALSDPAHPRYAIPFLVLSAAPVAVALAVLLGRATLPVLGAFAAASALVVLPAAGTYRATVSPPVAALRRAIAEAERRAAVVVADPTLVAFVELERVERGIPVTVLYSDQIASGQTPPPPPFATVAIWDDGHDGLVVRVGERQLFTCTEKLLRRLAQGRFLDLTVASNVSLHGGGT